MHVSITIIQKIPLKPNKSYKRLFYFLEEMGDIMFLKMKIKYLFIIRDYECLKKLIVLHDEIIKYLNDKEIEELLNFAVKEKEIILFSALLIFISESKKDGIVQNNVSYYLQRALENPIFLYSLSRYLSQNSKEYLWEIEKIKQNLSEKPLSEITIYILSLPGFYDKKIENRIIKNKNPHFLFNLLQNKTILETRIILLKYLRTTPKPKQIYYLAQCLASSEEQLAELKSIVINIEIDKVLKSQYLLAILEESLEKEPDLVLVRKIIDLNNFLTVDHLMKKISQEHQAVLISQYKDENVNEILFTLACTTNCEETLPLIDKILENISESNLIILLSNVDPKYFSHIVIEAIKEENMCLKIINKLYLMGSNRYEWIINYIMSENNNLVSKEKKAQLLEAMKKIEGNEPRKRTLT